MRVSAVYGAKFSEALTETIEFELKENATALFSLAEEK